MQPDMSLPALEVLEEATNGMAAMCARFYQQLVQAGLPEPAATELAYAFTEALAVRAFGGGG